MNLAAILQAIGTKGRSGGGSAGRLRMILLCAFLLTLSGCVRGCTSSRPPIHLNPNMDNQPKYLPQAESRFFYNGATMQPPVEGTVARGELRENPAFFTGKTPFGTFVQNPLTVDQELLARGHQRYDIYCSPCHGAQGDGQGMLFERAAVRSANLLEEKFRQMPDGQIFDTITNGFGLMPAYRYPISPRDRWAIVAYIRTLQQEPR